MFCMSVHVLTFFEMLSASFLILLTYSQRHRCTRRQASVVKQDESFPSDQVNLDPSCFPRQETIWLHLRFQEHYLWENGNYGHIITAPKRKQICFWRILPQQTHCTLTQISRLHCVPKSLATALVTSARRALRSLMQLAVCSRTSLMGRLCSKVKPLNCSTWCRFGSLHTNVCGFILCHCRRCVGVCAHLHANSWHGSVSLSIYFLTSAKLISTSLQITLPVQFLTNESAGTLKKSPSVHNLKINELMWFSVLMNLTRLASLYKY